MCLSVLVNNMSISIAVATYNEEKNLPSCLDSVRDWVEEIVVVDGGSTDRTVEIAKKYGAKIIESDNPSIFHINKQKAIDACKSDWILQLDADEIVSKSLKHEIIKTLKNESTEIREQSERNQESRIKNQVDRQGQSSVISHQSSINGFWLPRRNFFLGKWLKKGGQYPDYTLRLYRKGKGKLPCKTVHEQAEVEGEVGCLKNDLVHNAYPDFTEYLRKANTYTSLTARFLSDNKVRVNLVTGVEYFVRKPIVTFVSLYLRHLGFLDGFPGFVWALFSALHHPIAYIKHWEKKSGSSKK